MHPIAEDSLEPPVRRWALVAAALVAVFVAALAILAFHARPAPAGEDEVQAIDNGL
jgi:hypothetical protein